MLSAFDWQPGLTPSQDTELEDVRGHVDVEDLHQCEVHVDGLQPHPGEGGQQEVVQQGRCGHTQAVHAPGGQPGVDQKDQVQAQQRQGEVDEDLRGVVSPELPEEGKNVKVVDYDYVSLNDFYSTLNCYMIAMLYGYAK